MAKPLLESAWRERGANVRILARALNTPADKVSDEAVEVMAIRNLDISSHRPQGVTDSEVAESIQVLIMDEDLLDSARRRWPEHSSKMHRFMQFRAGVAEDVKDPFGTPGDYEIVAKKLERAVESFKASLKD